MGFICSTRRYRFNGWYFEWHSFCGPHPLKKDGDPRVRAGKKFFADIEELISMNDEDRMKHCVGGGCQRF